MPKVRQRTFNTVSAIIDFVLVVASMALAYWMRFNVLGGTGPVGDLFYHMGWAAVFALITVFLYALLGVYDHHSPASTMRTLGRVIIANTLATMLFIDATFIFRIVDFSRWLFVFFWLFTNILSCVKVIIVNHVIRLRHEHGLDQRNIVVIGSGPIAAAFAEGLAFETARGLKYIGNVGPHALPMAPPHLGTYVQLPTILDEIKPNEVVIALEPEESVLLDAILLDCESSGVKISVLPTYQQILSNKPRIDTMGGMTLINVNQVPLDNMGYALVKRLFDIIGSLVCIVITSPVMAVAVIGTKISSPGPVIFRQVRVGRGRQQFEMYKFRSMVVNDEEDTAWTTVDDPRRTRFGAFMRHYSIDELPQLFNVLKGDMSLIGPRPEIPIHVEEFKGGVSLYMVRHQVRPGMTGWAQVHGLRGDTSIEERIVYDLYYIQNWSILFDLRILAMTPFRGIVAHEEPLIRRSDKYQDTEDTSAE